MAKPVARHRISKPDYERARELRREMTYPEKLLWHKLRQLPKEWNLSFRRQQPIPPYIMDFVCMKLKLVIELDGFSHDTNRAQNQDIARDVYLNKSGFTVMRFGNDELLQNPDGVVTTILVSLKEISRKKDQNSN